MTVFQKLIEMPLTGRADSCAPASFAEEVLPAVLTARTRRRTLNYGTHLALGTMWGAAFGVVAASGLRGPKAMVAVFRTVYSGDVILNTALGRYEPGTWTHARTGRSTWSTSWSKRWRLA